jgi:5,10-methylenetetrahydromethanopterin reductase
MKENPDHLPPVIEDLSAFVIAGRVKARPAGPGEPETAARTPAQGIADGVEAERIGFRRIFLSERWNLKEAGVLLGAIGARTERVELGTGLIAAGSWHPLHAAALGSTLTAAFGPRVVIGLGRGDDAILNSLGLGQVNFSMLEDYVRILKQLWAGETVTYDGPAGRYPKMALGDMHEGPSPQVWFGTFGLPRAAKTIARVMDGVLLVPNLTPGATRASIARIHEECERIDRDPASVHIAQCVITAPDLDETETRQLAHARALTYLQAPGYGEALCRANGWDASVLDALNAHEQIRRSGEAADQAFHRSELLEPAKLVPDEWMQESCAIGSVDECLASLRRFRAAGADEIVTYGSTPGQNATLAKAWAADHHATAAQ